MEKAYGKYFIAIIPNGSTSELVKIVRERYDGLIEIPKTPTHSTLKESFFTSHIEECITKLEKAFKNFEPFDVSVTRYDLFSHKHLVLTMRNNMRLQALHVACMKTSQEYVENVVPFSPIDKLSPFQKTLLEEYNNPYCFMFYTPHITIGSIKSSSALERINKELRLLSPKSRFDVNYVAIIDKEKNSIYHKIYLK
jgi:2'-5' RNA ligase